MKTNRIKKFGSSILMVALCLGLSYSSLFAQSKNPDNKKATVKKETKSNGSTHKNNAVNKSKNANYKNGVNRNKNNTKVARLPIGKEVKALPQGCKTRKISGKTYYQHGENYYKTVYKSNGLKMYRVVKV